MRLKIYYLEIDGNKELHRFCKALDKFSVSTRDRIDIDFEDITVKNCDFTQEIKSATFKAIEKFVIEEMERNERKN